MKSKSKKVVNNKFGVIEEKLSLASPSRPACSECSLHARCNEPFLTPFVPDDWTGDYLFVVEVSREGEDNIGHGGLPLGVNERTVLKRCLGESSLEKNQVAFVPVLRCRPILKGSKKPKMSSLRACRPFLIRVIHQLKPQTVFAFGETCYKGLMNSGKSRPVAKLRGRALQSPDGVSFFVTYKVSSLTTDPYIPNRVIEDLRRSQQEELAYPGPGLGHSKLMAFDTEYTGEVVHCVGVSSGTCAMTTQKPDVKQFMGRTIIGHNIVVDLEALLRTKVYPKDMEEWLQGRKIRDTQLMARLVDENRGKYGYMLESLLTSFYNVKDYKVDTDQFGPDSSRWPKPLRDERCRLDAWSTYKVYEALEPYVEGPVRLTHAIALSLRRMYWSGIYIDPARFKRFNSQVKKTRMEALAAVEGYAKEFGIKEFSATKDDDLREYVYGKNGVGLAVETLTDGGLPTVSAKTLKEFKDKPAIAALLHFSKYDKLFTTYGENLLGKCIKLKDGLWIPVQINPLAARTGRRASSNPNLQNWPVAARQIIVSRFKGGVIADNDYSKLEPILGGWVTGEPKLTDYFIKYPNGYIKIGEDFFKTSVDKNSDQYKAVKSLVLAILYNKKQWSLAEDLWVNYNVKLDSNYEKHTEKAGEILEDFLDLFPLVRKYHERQEQTVLKTGRVVNALGQVRRLPLPPEPPRSERWAYKAWYKYRARVINQSINYPIQSLASYVTGCGLVDLEAAFLREWQWTYVDYQTALMEKKWPNMPLLCIEVHDDLVEDIPKGMDKKAKDLTHAVMQKPPSLAAVLPELFDSNVRLSVDTNVAETWGQKS